ncbi:MAG: Calx-beta domain-containing protein [Planctomycetota bacterium]
MATRLLGATTPARRTWALSQLPTAAWRRALVVESLEGRALMAITPLSIAYKPLDFTGSVAISGAISGSLGNYPTTGSFTGQLGLSGKLDYSSTTAGVGTATVNGSVSGSIFGYSKNPITLNVNGSTPDGGLVESSSRLTATLPPVNDVSSVSLTGSYNTRDYSVSGNLSFKVNSTINWSGTWKGKIVQQDATPVSTDNFGFSANWDDAGKFGVVDVAVTVGGGLPQVNSRTASIANIRLYWGDAAGKTIGAPLRDVINISWNQSAGSYEISGLPSAPSSAQKLILIGSVGTKVDSQVALNLPARPTISINDMMINLPATGTVSTGTATFTVSLSGPTLAPVKVKYATVDGTATVGQDFLGRSGTLTFNPGGPLTQTFTVAVRRDSVLSTEQFFAQLSSASWGTIAGTGRGTATIQDVA